MTVAVGIVVYMVEVKLRRRCSSGGEEPQRPQIGHAVSHHRCLDDAGRAEYLADYFPQIATIEIRDKKEIRDKETRLPCSPGSFAFREQ
jgi:hypothetical protein